MTNPVTVRYMSRSELESLMYSLTAASNNEQAQLFEAIARRLLEIMEQESRR
ncbi:cell developmental protein SirA [Parathalassolituus penaei]|uniref:Cell developmental protein SirA n=1 Tax=Parathalassolituus penaei TaxID=2997323 RepID=A0A9X3IV32_9GAMM|nr:cell developmental protein SirA [Parathalassolituus penaei]MCY0966818.1 cell developmental protein SirA [Parathalassolituus penaei]